jgi:hypothetical protein
MTDDELLHAALNEDESQWAALHEQCRDRRHAEALARVLEAHATVDNDAAGAWAQVLADLHPGLVVKLRAARAS